MARKVEGGSIILTPTDARMLYQAARIGDLRSRFRVGDTALFRLLTDIATCAFTITPNTVPGNMTRQSTASEDRETWTVNRLATATGRAPRTVRLDIQRQALPAKKLTNSWLITPTDAATYIRSHRN